MDIPDDANKKEHTYGTYSRGLYMPYFKEFPIPKSNKEIEPDPELIGNSCGFKIISGGAMGAVMGVVMGLFTGAMGGDVSAIQILKGREVPTAPLREQMRSAYKNTAVKCGSWARSFGVLTALFGGIECVIEKGRAKHDVWNPVISGCLVGATLSAKQGPAASCVGCVGFAGFSYLVDKVMGTH